uniref:Peptidase A2 domain-containing protein n=1 Tax=Gouania willdenowi TaxID=441366 RepID=A0A8C5DUL0_GOUWI
MRVTYLEEAEDQVNQLITENKELEKSKVLLGDKIRVLEHDFDTTTRELDTQLHESNDGKKLLLEAEGAIKASKAKTKLLSRELDAERERVNDLLQQVADGKVATAKVQRQLNLTRRELLDARRELGHALSSLSMSEADGDPDSDGEDATRQVLRTADPPVRPRRLRRPRDASADPPIDGGPTPARPPNSNRPSNRDLDKIARNIPRFEPKFDEPQNARAFLRDIDFYLKSYPMANVEDKIYLIKATSSRLVNDFIERQLPQIRNDYTTLCRLMVDEFSDALHQTGFDYAHTIKQGKNESPQQYYHTLLQAYFGNRNDPGMEEEEQFKQLFLRNLHHSTSTHLGVAADPYTMSSKKLRDLAIRGFLLYKQNSAKSTPREMFPIKNNSHSLQLEGIQKELNSPQMPPPQAPQTTPRYNQQPYHGIKPKRYQDNTDYRDYAPKQNFRHQNSRPNSHHQDRRPRPPWYDYDRSDQWKRHDNDRRTPPLRNKHSKPRYHKYNQRSYDQQPNRSRSDDESNEIESLEIRLSNQITKEMASIKKMFEQMIDDKTNDKPKQSKRKNDDDSPRAVLLVQTHAPNHHFSNGHQSIEGEPPIHQLLCNLYERGIARKFYISATFEGVLTNEALLDTGADISLMSAQLFNELRSLAKETNLRLILQDCHIDIEPYGDNATVITKKALVQVTIGHLTLVHPFYIS